MKGNIQPVLAGIVTTDAGGSGVIFAYITTDVVISFICIGLFSPGGVDDFLFEFFAQLWCQLRIYILCFIFKITYPECFYIRRRWIGIFKAVFAGGIVENYKKKTANYQTFNKKDNIILIA